MIALVVCLIIGAFIGSFLTLGVLGLIRSAARKAPRP